MERQIRILALTRYDRLGASTRLRCLQFFPFLQERGFVIDHSPLLGDAYLQRYYSGAKIKPVGDVIWPLFKRILIMLRARQYDVIWLEKEALPFFPWLVEAMAGFALPPIVADYDDAVFHNYDLHRSAFVRALLGQKIDRVMANAQVVIAGNQYLAARAMKAGARHIKIVPTVLDPDRYSTLRPHDVGNLKIGWIGTKSTSKYLHSIAPALARAQKELNADIVIIGANDISIPDVTPTYVTWSEATEAESIRHLDIGIMPITDNPWDRGKCGYKLLQYMACGLPVVASPIGANSEIVLPGRTGFLAESQEAWFDAFKTLHSDKSKAKAFGDKGRARLVENYSIEAVLPAIEQALRFAANRHHS